MPSTAISLSGVRFFGFGFAPGSSASGGSGASATELEEESKAAESTPAVSEGSAPGDVAFEIAKLELTASGFTPSRLESSGLAEGRADA